MLGVVLVLAAVLGIGFVLSQQKTGKMVLEQNLSDVASTIVLASNLPLPPAEVLSTVLHAGLDVAVFSSSTSPGKELSPPFMTLADKVVGVAKFDPRTVSIPALQANMPPGTTNSYAVLLARAPDKPVSLTNLTILSTLPGFLPSV